MVLTRKPKLRPGGGGGGERTPTAIGGVGGGWDGRGRGLIGSGRRIRLLRAEEDDWRSELDERRKWELQHGVMGDAE